MFLTMKHGNGCSIIMLLRTFRILYSMRRRRAFKCNSGISIPAMPRGVSLVCGWVRS